MKVFEVEKLQRVLHVEDDPSILMVTSVTLEKVGNISVLSCASGKEALEKAADFDPQVVLLDVMMPGMDGPSTLQELKLKIDMSNRLILFMTAKVQHNELDYYTGLGAQDVIIKPFDPMTLSKQLQDQWQRWCDR